MHLFDSHVAQDSTTTSAVILDVAHSITEQFPDTSRFHLWSDIASCYENNDTLLSLFHSKLFSAYDLCEMQDGKGACDRMAATIKSAVGRYVNKGHDVVSPLDLKQVHIYCICTFFMHPEGEAYSCWFVCPSVRPVIHVRANSQQLLPDFSETSWERSVPRLDAQITGMLWSNEFSWSYGPLINLILR